MRWAQNVACMGQNRCAFKASVANILKERDHWNTYIYMVNGRIIT
jgi:hypothetical protein